ncbi:helix-turn-helix domain-containing protein [Corynebacterium sp. 32222D000AT]
MRAKGLSMRAIATEIGCSVGTVHRYVKETLG